MAIILYDFAISCFRLLLWSISPFHTKAKSMIQGRQHWQSRLLQDFEDNTAPVVWIHCASLGEFEQGRPLIDSLNRAFPHYKILLTFYSPSGYQVRKNYPNVQAVHYLPWDTAANAHKFFQIVNPVVGILIKYEFWYHLITEGKKRNRPLIVCSAIFNRNQVFFKPYGGFFRKLLDRLDHIFVQNANSLKLLREIGIVQVTVAGDTRVDRVTDITRETIQDSLVERFAGGSEMFIVGSSWPRDIEILSDLINSEKHLKFVIAPHEIDEHQLTQTVRALSRPYVTYTDFRESSDAEILIVNTIGILSHLYQYGKYAYIGGAFGKGLHNILEAATFGLPLFFGNKNYQKFAEANALVDSGGAFAVGDTRELRQKYRELEEDENKYHRASSACRHYVEENRGATDIILNHIKTRLP